MKKFALLFAAALCLPVLGLTGCGRSGETTVIKPTESTSTESTIGVDEEAYNKAMEAEMAKQPGN